MTDHVSHRRSTLIWVVLLTLASGATTLALACATPFAALAAVAATRMRARAGAALMLLAWAVSQGIGFGVLGYPHDPVTLLWGAAILSAALASIAAARVGAAAVQSSGGVVQVATAFGTGFIGYKAVLLGWSFVLGGVHVAASPYWTARQFGREAAILLGLLALYRLLVAAGVPAAGGRVAGNRDHALA